MRRLFIILTLLFSALSLNAQNVIDLIISEVMVENDSSVVDDYGRHSSWVELFNTSQGTVNFGGCYFSDDLDNLTKSPITRTDKRTSVGPRQVVLFYATGDSSEGTFYLNFTLRPGSTLYLVSNDGRTVIDEIDIPESIPAGQSISKFAHDNKQIVFDTVEASVPTPGSINGTVSQRPKSDVLAETDPYGFTLTVVSVTVVFAALIILFVIYDFSGKCFSGKINFRRKRAVKSSSKMSPEVAAAIAMAFQSERGGEVEAAIATALHLYLGDGTHDAESFVLTIRPQQGQWGDKSLNFRRKPL